jgi:hypothetical protein
MTLRPVFPLILALCVCACSLPQNAKAQEAVAFGFEFNTSGDVEGWQHNGANGGTGGTSQLFLTDGTGVITGTGSNGDLRVLHNPDLALPGGFLNWTSIDIRFRQLDDTGAPRQLSGAGQAFTINSNTIGVTDGSLFMEESPGSTDYWNIATLDITAAGTGDITQIRIDPIGGTGLGYELDYVRVNAAAVPEPAGLALVGVGALAILLVRRRRK